MVSYIITFIFEYTACNFVSEKAWNKKVEEDVYPSQVVYCFAGKSSRIGIQSILWVLLQVKWLAVDREPQKQRERLLTWV